MTQLETFWINDVESVLKGSCFDELLEAVRSATVFNTREWLESAANHLPAGKQLRVLVALQSDRLMAWLPLVLGTESIHGIRVRTMRLLGYPYTDRCSLLLRDTSDEIMKVIVSSMAQASVECDLMILNELYDKTEKHRLLESLVAASLQNDVVHASRSPVLRFSDDQKENNRNTKAPSSRLRRAKRKILKAGTVEFTRFLPTCDEVPEILQLFKSLEDVSWKGQNNLGIFSEPTSSAFFEEVATRFAKHRRLDTATLNLNGTAISYRFGFRYRGVFYDYNLAFDPEYARYAPGRLLLDHVIESSRALGLTAVDASRSNTADMHLLSEWTEDYIEHHDIWIFLPTFRSRLLAFVRRHVRPALRKIQARFYNAAA